MIVQRTQDLPRFDKDEMLTIDIESTSFDDKKEGLNVFQGSRICGVAVCTMDGQHSWYVPMRNRVDPAENILLFHAQAWLKDLIESGRDIVNHFIKFDARFWHFEGCKAKGRLIDTAVMARLCQSDLLNLSLNHLSGGKKDKRVKTFLRTIKSKDYGRVPVSIIGPYAETDAIETASLYRKFKKKMRAECKDVWNTEIGLTKHLVKEEIKGFRIDVEGLKITYRNLLRRMLILQQEIDELAGCEVDCLSSPSLNEVLVNKMGFKIQSYTSKKHPQWNKAALIQLDHPIGQKIQEFTHLSYFTTTFCKGWLDRMGDDGRIHANFTQAAARTGRMASKDPCVTNLPIEAEMHVLPDEGCVILGHDYSQIEYRIFAHYSKDEKIIASYKGEKDVDYHQMLANMMGVPRNFAKSLNFSFIYGMGKKTLLHTIAGIIAISKDDEQMVEKLRAFGLVAGRSFARTVKDMDFKDFEAIASGVYTEYHKKIPAMKHLKARITSAIQARGWLRNYLGRIYTVAPQAVYKAVNLLIQGSAADIFKNRMLAVADQMSIPQMITNVYDSLYYNVPQEDIRPVYLEQKRILEDFNMRVPLKVKSMVSERSLGTCVGFESVNGIREAMKESLTMKPVFRRKTIRAADFLLPGQQKLSQ